jgi:hypothetical protein
MQGCIPKEVIMLRKAMAALVVTVTFGSPAPAINARGGGAAVHPFSGEIVDGYTGHRGRISVSDGRLLKDGGRDVWGHWGEYYGPMVHGP